MWFIYLNQISGVANNSPELETANFICQREIGRLLYKYCKTRFFLKFLARQNNISLNFLTRGSFLIAKFWARGGKDNHNRVDTGNCEFNSRRVHQSQSDLLLFCINKAGFDFKNHRKKSDGFFD